MAIRSRDIYESRKKKRSRKGLYAIAALAILIVAVLLFYGMRSLCIYDEQGNAHIVWPFSQESKDLKAQETAEIDNAQSIYK